MPRKTLERARLVQEAIVADLADEIRSTIDAEIVDNLIALARIPDEMLSPPPKLLTLKSRKSI